MTMISLMPGRLDEGFAGSRSYAERLTEDLFTPAYRPRFEAMGPQAQKRTFYKWLESRGLKIHEVPQYVVRAKADSEEKTRGRDPAAYREGNEIYIATDFHGRKLTDEEMVALAAHEYPGHEYSRSEKGANEAAKGVMSAFGYSRPLEVLDMFDENLRKAGMTYSLN